jgi:hypothetical protein
VTSVQEVDFYVTILICSVAVLFMIATAYVTGGQLDKHVNIAKELLEYMALIKHKGSVDERDYLVMTQGLKKFL